MVRKGLLLLVAISAIVVTSAVDNLAQSEDKVAVAASKVVEALEDHPFKADGVAPEQQPAVAGSQDHPKGRIVPRKGAVMNVTLTSSTTTSTTTSTPIAASVPKATEAQHKNITTTVATPQVSVGNNATVVGPAVANATLNGSATPTSTNVTVLGNATTSDVAVPSASKPTTVTSSTTSTTTTTTSTTTTTTKPPKKPKITYSVDDEPKLAQAAKPGYSSAAGSTVSDVNGRLHVEEPLAELSKEYIAPPAATLLGDPSRNSGHREYVIPIVTLIFAVPLLAGLFLLSYRRAKEFWLTRHYRRMDFLVDGMYNY